MPAAIRKNPAAVTPMAFAAAIVRAYRQVGVDPAGALKAAQIAPASVRDANARITADQMEALSAHAMQELDDEALGWFSRRLPWGSYGMLARASITAPNLGVALRRWCRHHNLLTDDVVLNLRTEGDSAVLSIEERRDLGAMREICMVTTLRNAIGLSSWFIDSRIALQAAAFNYAAPAQHAEAYEVLFPAPVVKFGVARSEVRFATAYLAQPVRRDEAALQQMLRRALPLTVLQYRRDRLLVQQVRAALMADPAASHSADTLAGKLNISARTLHRQLKDEGASLQQLKDEVRFERAKEMLNRSGKAVKQIAAATGFRNEKSFIRAFRGWAGMGPGEMRQRKS